jgi:hypothetical protein
MSSSLTNETCNEYSGLNSRHNLLTPFVYAELSVLFDSRVIFVEYYYGSFFKLIESKVNNLAAVIYLNNNVIIPINLDDSIGLLDELSVVSICTSVHCFVDS